MHLHNVTLEMSLKPFRQTDDAFVRTACGEIFQQWQALLRHSDVVSVMLWTADGSEILDYKGDLHEPLEWARYVGHANPKTNAPHDPDGRALHSRGYPYMEEPPTLTYGDLKRIVAMLKEVGVEVTGKPIRAGAAFDPGPEFAKSPFKYERHPEVCLGESMGAAHFGFVTCYAALTGDDRLYAGFPFRFYTHDPWWLNSPWLDRYGREPHDLYLPLSVGRLSANGDVQTPNSVEFLTIDDSYGQTPVKVPNEVIPCLLEAKDHAPDAPGPLVWIYPWDEYHELTFDAEPRLDEVFFGDWFMRGAVNQGLPLNTVVSSRSFQSTVGDSPKLYRESVLVSRVPDGGTALSEQLVAWVASGGKVLLYGPLAHAGADLLKLLGAEVAKPLGGEAAVDLAFCLDVIAGGAYPRRLVHRPILCGGGLEGVLADGNDPCTEMLATASSDSAQRPLALFRAAPVWNGGAVAWVRGANSFSCRAESHLPTPDDPAEVFDAPMLMRFALAKLGLSLVAEKHSPEQRPPLVTIARNNNGFFFSGYTPNTTVGLRMRFPQGAPLLVGFETRLLDGHSTYRMPRAWHRECRVFVDGQGEGEVSCVEQHSGEIGIRRRLRVSDLRDATVRFYPERGTKHNVRFLRALMPAYVQENWLETRTVCDNRGSFLEAEGVAGSLLISW